MSKIGRKPIKLTDIKVEIKGQEVHYKGKIKSGVYVLPPELSALVDNDMLLVNVRPAASRLARRTINRLWGLHRALLANAIAGAAKEFERDIEIQGLGYKAVLSGNKVTLSLGYSHKIDFVLPQGVSLSINKSGQKLTFKSDNKELLGQVCSQIRALKEPEPYKGTGIRYADEIIKRKAGKAKAA